MRIKPKMGKTHKPAFSRRTRNTKTKNIPHKPQIEDNENGAESDIGEDMLGMVEEDDLTFLKNAISNSSYRIFDKIRCPNQGPKRARKRKKETTEDDELENEYENREPAVKKKQLLPIKSKSNVIIPQSIEQDEDGNDVEMEEDAPQEEEEEEKDDDEEASDNEGEYDVELDDLFDANKLTTAQLLARRSSLLHRKKLHIGNLSSALLENPEEKIENFRQLIAMLDDNTPEICITVRKLATLSLLEIFKDVLPSYQIKLQDITSVKVKKDTLKLHKFETSLLQHYKKFLQQLEKSCKNLQRKDRNNVTEGERLMALVSLKALCELLRSHPYFNFAPNIAQALVPFLNNANPKARSIVADACKQIFKEDTREEITLRIMRLINQYLRNHSHNVNIEMLQIFLALRIKDVNLDQEKEQELKEKKLMDHKQRVMNLSKKEKKRKKRLDELERELLETRAEESKQMKQQNLVEITKILFGIYFRILKSATNTNILGACLEGLAKFAHCINWEYYTDIVSVIDKLLKEDWIDYREKLHCIQTVFGMLSGQGEAVNVDPTRFYVYLYSEMLTVNAARKHANFTILLYCLINAIIKRRKRITNKRLIGFVKRLATLSLQLVHNGTICCLAVIKSIMQFNKSVDILIDHENTIGDGVYDPTIEDPEYSGAGSTSMYELAILNKHYHPIVVKYAQHIAYGVPGSGEGSLPPELGKSLYHDLYDQFDMSEMAFNPSIPPGKQCQPKLRTKPHKFADVKFQEFCSSRSKLIPNEDNTFFMNNMLND